MIKFPSKPKNIVVIGDFIIDHYRFLNPARVSAEAPVLIFSDGKEESRPGGAGNVAKNLETFGMDVTLCSILGDGIGVDLGNIKTIFEFLPERKTTVKERLLSMGQQLMRIDHQNTTPISNEQAQKFLDKIDSAILMADAVVFSDYAHGILTPELVCPVIQMAKRNKKPVIVDTKSKDSLEKYRGCTIALPNKAESVFMLKLEHDTPNEDIARKLLMVMELDAIGLTLGPAGIMLLEQKGEPKIYPAYRHEDEVVDVTGAGDTVTASVALGLASGMALSDCMVLANVAAGLVVQKLGVSTVMPAEIEDVLNKRGEQ